MDGSISGSGGYGGGFGGYGMGNPGSYGGQQSVGAPGHKDGYHGTNPSGHDDRNPSASSNKSNCTGLNTNHVTCTISDVYGGTPPQETEEEEGSNETVQGKGEGNMKPNPDDNNKDYYNENNRSTHWNGHATDQNIPSQKDLDNVSNVEKLDQNSWGNTWNRSNPNPDCDYALGDLDSTTNCRFINGFHSKDGVSFHDLSGG